jgi:hypothetical protein
MLDPPRVSHAERLKRSEPPARLYHYTSTQGLLGIVQSNGIWATDVAYLNDSSELEYGLRDLLKRIEIMTRSDRSRAERSFLDKLASRGGFDQWATVADIPSDAIDPNVYRRCARDIMESIQADSTIGVACFCSDDGDSLTQWRGYGNAGYSIGFSARVLAERTRAFYLELTEVVYGRASGRALWTGKTLYSMVDSIFESRVSPATALGNPGADSVSLALVGLAAQVKDEAFEPEREWRIGDKASSQDPRLSYRPGALGVVPYIELSLGPTHGSLPIEHICVAPGPDAPLRVSAVKSLMRRHGYEVGDQRGQVLVTSSAIPFRG